MYIVAGAYRMLEDVNVRHAAGAAVATTDVTDAVVADLAGC